MNNRIDRMTFRRASVLGLVAAVSAFAFSCSSGPPESMIGAGSGSTSTNGGATSNGPGGPGTGATINLGGDLSTGMAKGPCKDLECKVKQCGGNTKTTITGKVYDPAGKIPLYNVAVYVPNAPVMPFAEGASCDRCGASILNPVTAAITDETGAFTLQDAPSGADIPLVIQVGKWRRQIKIPMVADCVDNPLTDPQVTRLPRNKMEGDIPKIAFSAGAADQMECLPLRMGVDASEFTNSAGDGRIHLFTGDHDRNGPMPLTQLDADHGGATLTTSAADLWASVDTLKKYDIVILSCEGMSGNRTPAMRQAMYAYASLGGRVFASHLHSNWFSQGPQPVPTTGTWRSLQNPPDPSAATINQTFPKGEALAKWLVNVQATPMQGQMSVTFPRNDLQAVNTAVATEWITLADPVAVQYMSFNAPIGVEESKVCGREVFTGLHVASVDNTMLPALNVKGFPASCEVRDLSAQEKAVAFMLFDLSACIQTETDPIKPPK